MFLLPEAQKITNGWSVRKNLIPFKERKNYASLLSTELNSLGMVGGGGEEDVDALFEERVSSPLKRSADFRASGTECVENARFTAGARISALAEKYSKDIEAKGRDAPPKPPKRSKHQLFDHTVLNEWVETIVRNGNAGMSGLIPQCLEKMFPQGSAQSIQLTQRERQLIEHAVNFATQ